MPLDERGLLLADGVFETVLVLEARPQLLEAHLRRWRAGATFLRLPQPPGASVIGALLAEAVRRSGIRNGALRLNWSRGGGGRGLLPAEAGSGRSRFWLQLSPARPSHDPVRLVLSRLHCRNGHSPLSRHKCFAYTGSVLARLEARNAGADDALLASSRGGIACATAANVLVADPGRRGSEAGWLTPPLSSGCLPGVMRGRALQLGLAREAALTAAQVLRGPTLLLNSLGCRPLGCSPALAHRLFGLLLRDEGAALPGSAEDAGDSRDGE
ncbi:4-amino-4-deoxychorismate lyase [Synechococcus sp. RSCCF101]|nr:4-amino-4-deoxychorismate lyase [Synechococcus sp. RSCCF101]